MRTYRICDAVTLFMSLLLGCGSSTPAGNTNSAQAAKNDDEDEEVSPKETAEEKKYIEAAMPFVSSIAKKQYTQAYQALSSHARARMSLNQFNPEHDDKKFDANEKNPKIQVSAEQFAELMKRAENAFGEPRKAGKVHVFSTDSAVLSRKGDNALDAMFAIGAMPDSVPASIRKASLRGQIKTQLSAAQMERAAKEMHTTPEELKKDHDFNPYFTIKVVLVEEAGELRVGYFEFLPPGILD